MFGTKKVRFSHCYGEVKEHWHVKSRGTGGTKGRGKGGSGQMKEMPGNRIGQVRHIGFSGFAKQRKRYADTHPGAKPDALPCKIGFTQAVCGNTNPYRGNGAKGQTIHWLGGVWVPTRDECLHDADSGLKTVARSI